MPNSKGSSYRQFRHELIKRFFHPKSYFFLCLSTQLQDISNVATDVTEEDYLLIGQVMQHLIDAANPEELLDRFKTLERFSDFHRTLEDSIHHLHQPGLSPEEMKQTIESLANDFVEVLIDVIHDPVEKNRFMGLLKQESGTEAAAEARAEDPLKIDEINESVVDEIKDRAETIPQTPENTHEEAPPVQQTDLTLQEDQISREDLPLPVEPEHSEALPVDDSAPLTLDMEETEAEPVVEEPPPVPAAPPPENVQEHSGSGNEFFQPPETNLKESDSSCHDSLAEPLSLSGKFSQEAERDIAELEALIAKLKPEEPNRGTLQKLKKRFLDLREAGMIHGFSDFEDVSRKGQMLTERLLKSSSPLSLSFIRLYQDFPPVLRLSLQDDDHPERRKIADFIQEINRVIIMPDSGEYQSPFIQEREESGKVEAEAGAAQTSPLAADTETAQPVPDYPEPEPESDAPQLTLQMEEERPEEERPPVQQEPSQDIPALEAPPVAEEPVRSIEPLETDFDEETRDLRLPGEDDPELLKLIQEVAGHDQHQNNNQTSPTSVDSGSANPDAQLDQLLNELIAAGQARVSIQDDAIRNFQNEAKLYFKVIAEALGNLKENGKDRLALENLELASYSLKGLGKKLGLEHIANFPELVEEYVGKLILLHQPLKIGNLTLITEGFTYLARVADKKDIEHDRMRQVERQLLKAIRSLDEKVNAMDESLADSQSLPKPANDAAGKTTNTFRLKGRQPRPPLDAGGISKRDQKNPMAGLDFLMNDDTDLLGLED